MKVSKKSQIEKLLELKQLYESGVLTKEEMEAEKAKILDRATPKDDFSTRETAPVERQVSSTASTDNKDKHKTLLGFGIAIITILIVGAIIVLNLNKRNESASVSKDDAKLSQQTAVDSSNGNGEQETDKNADEKTERQVIGTLTAYYAKRDFEYYKKGQLICDNIDPMHKIVEVDDNNFKYESWATDGYYSCLIPKTNLTKKEYTMYQLTINDIGDKSLFGSNGGRTAKIFKSNINGHHYLGYNGEVNWKETNNHKECYVVSIRFFDDDLFEQPLMEKDGTIELNLCQNYWNGGEEWGYEKSAYDESGNLLVDQRPRRMADEITIAYIADIDALYISGDLYYRKFGHEDDSQRQVDDNDKNNAVKMPTIQDISRFSDDCRNNYKAILDYGFTLVDRQSRIEYSAYEDDNSEYELIKEVYSLKYNSDSRTSDIFDGNMTITCVYSEDYGEPCIKIECDKYSWKKLKKEADNYLELFWQPEIYSLNNYCRINFEHEGVIEITSDMSKCWE